MVWVLLPSYWRTQSEYLRELVHTQAICVVFFLREMALTEAPASQFTLGLSVKCGSAEVIMASETTRPELRMVLNLTMDIAELLHTLSEFSQSEAFQGNEKPDLPQQPNAEVEIAFANPPLLPAVAAEEQCRGRAAPQLSPEWDQPLHELQPRHKGLAGGHTHGPSQDNGQSLIETSYRSCKSKESK